MRAYNYCFPAASFYVLKQVDVVPKVESCCTWVDDCALVLVVRDSGHGAHVIVHHD